MKTLLFVIAVALLPGAATRAESPPPNYIDKGVCPFECCVYRAWNTKTDTVAYAKPAKNAKVVGLLKAGATVEMQAFCPSCAPARPPWGGHVEAGSELTTILPAKTLPEAIKAMPIPRVAGRTSGRTA
jgi:hypothetical protein